MDVIYGKAVEGERGHGCRAPHDLFKSDWREVPRYLRDMVPSGGLGCDGGGHAGHWCVRGSGTCQWYAEVFPSDYADTFVTIAQ